MKIVKLILVGYRGFRLRQIHHFEYTPDKKTQVILGTNGSGKAQPLSAKVKVPQGWSRMGNLRIGSEVIAKDGATTKVTEISPQGIKPVFKITFSDGRATRVTGDHLWKVYCARKYPIIPEIVTTDEIIRRLAGKAMERLMWIDLPDAEDSPHSDLPVDPYVLGVILGDGSISGSGVSITHPDEQIRLEVDSRLKDNISTIPYDLSNPGHCLVYSIANNDGIRKGPKSNYVLNYIRSVGLKGCRSHEKFIPPEYLNASREQRLELLQGLMDTDGYIDLQSTSSYCTTSEQLAKDVQYLVRSLGGLARIAFKYPFYRHEGERKEGKKAYNVHIRYKKPSELFKLAKKKVRANDNNQYAKTLRLRIVSIEALKPEACQCIAIDHPEKLYVTDDFIVTHNSSLLKELSPLPANFQDFEKEGRKEITIEHNKKQYVLQSLFDEEGKRYPFYLDGRNLNPGNTLTVYRELVKEHFNYTLEVQQLLIGSLRFHEMSAVDRRNWFMKISDVDYTYAYKYFGKLKDKVRDLQGALKHNQARLTEETEKCLSQKDEAALRVKIEGYHRVLNDLLLIRIPRLSNKEEVESKLRQAEEAIVNDLNALESIIAAPNALKSFNLAEILESSFISLQSEISSLKGILVYRCEVVEKHQNAINIAKVNSQTSKEDVERTIASLDKEKMETLDRVRLPLTFEDPLGAERSLSAIFEDLRGIYTQLTMLPKTQYMREHFQELVGKRPTLTHQLEVLKRTEIALFQEIKHLKEHLAKGEINCPKCAHVWVPNFDQARLDKFVIQRSQTLAEIERLEKVSTENEAAILEHETHFKLLDKLNYHVRTFPSLAPLWLHIKHSEKLFSEPDSLNHDLQTLRSDFQEHVKALQLETRLVELRKTYESILNAGEIDLNKIEKELVEENEKLLKVQGELQVKEAKLREVKELIELQKSITNLSTRVRGNLKYRGEAYQKLFDSERMHLLDELIYRLRSELSHSERALSQIDIQKGLVVDLKKQVAAIEEDLSTLKLAMQVLSPSEGLIAKGMMGFINHFVNQVNQFIAKFWLYPLEIKPLKVTDDDNILDLDYKFPVSVNNDTRMSKDVAETSAGMREVIDLAFVAVSMQYLGLSHSPIFLDEFAKTLDPAHRQMAYQAIDHLIESDNYTQVFLVSHYQDGYTALGECDISVLCDSNIQIPKHLAYNKNVKFKSM